MRVRIKKGLNPKIQALRLQHQDSHRRRLSPITVEQGFSPVLSYDALAARRGAARRAVGVAFAAFARATARLRVMKLRSSAFSTRLSIDSAVSRITSEISDTIRNLARSSMRFSRNDRLLDRLSSVRLFSTSATS